MTEMIPIRFLWTSLTVEARNNYGMIYIRILYINIVIISSLSYLFVINIFYWGSSLLFRKINWLQFGYPKYKLIEL
jgi:hypothetical protein